MLGTRVLFEGEGPATAQTLADKLGTFINLHKLGCRTLWETEPGAEEFDVGPGLAKLSYVVIYYDGAGVFLEMKGSGAPKSNADLARLLSGLRIHVRASQVHITSNTKL